MATATKVSKRRARKAHRTLQRHLDTCDQNTTSQVPDADTQDAMSLLDALIGGMDDEDGEDAGDLTPDL